MKLTLLLILVLVLGGVAPATAQHTTLERSTIAPSKNPAVIRNQLTLALKYGRKTLAGLEATPPNLPMPPEESVTQAARDTYVLIRSAMAGIDYIREGQRIPDPLIELAFKKVTDAWNLSRFAVDGANQGAPSRQQYLARAIRDLDQALRFVDQALVLLP